MYCVTPEKITLAVYNVSSIEITMLITFIEGNLQGEETGGRGEHLLCSSFFLIHMNNIHIENHKVTCRGMWLTHDFHDNIANPFIPPLILESSSYRKAHNNCLIFIQSNNLGCVVCTVCSQHEIMINA